MDAPPIEPPPTAAPPPRAQRRLERSSRDCLLGGVAGGIAEYLGVDPVLVRLGFVVTAFFGGVGVIAYVIGWVVLPVTPAPTTDDPRRTDRKQLLGYALVAVGLLVVGGRLGWEATGKGVFWPVLLIGLGVAVLFLRSRDSQRGRAPAIDVREPGTVEDTAPVTMPMSPQVPTDEPPMTPEDARARPRSYLGAVTCSALLILAGGAWLLDASGTVDMDLGVLFALALVIVGVALVVSTWFGRARALIALGIPLVLVVSAFGLVDVPLEGGIGDPMYRPHDVAAMKHSYELAIGNLSLDLRSVDFSGTRRRVHAQVGIGKLNLTVPEDVRVVVDAHVGLGDVTAFGVERDDECCPSDLRLVEPGTGGGTLLIDADVGAGSIDIERGELIRGPS